MGQDSTDGGAIQGYINTRQKFIHGRSEVRAAGTGTPASFTAGTGLKNVPASSAANGLSTPTGYYPLTRRYQVSFALGLMTQDKLIPTKFMASQLAIEITLEQAQACIYRPDNGASVTLNPTYAVSNVNLIPEILEFDASYDEMFLRGLREGGVPIKFSSWHTFIFSSGSSSNVNLQIQERSRSVKSLFAVQRRTQPAYDSDSHATFFDTSYDGQSSLQAYQFRIGGRYFPAAPVQCSTEIGSGLSNGGAEAFVELQKALNNLGDYRMSSSVNTARWALQNAAGVLQEKDFSNSIRYIDPSTGVPVLNTLESKTNGFCGTLGSQCFTMSTNLETSNGAEISGLNAEEQSDISLLATWKTQQVTGSSNTASSIEVYSYYDAMIILRENNVLELIQ